MLQLHHESLIMKHTSMPFFLPERCLFLSARCLKKPGCCTDSDNISRVSHVSVKQTFFSNLYIVVKRLYIGILGSGERCARLQNLTRRPLCLPLLRRRCLGSPTGIRLSWVVVGTEDPLRESCIPGRNVGKLCWLTLVVCVCAFLAV